jgi:hypothetical protein
MLATGFVTLRPTYALATGAILPAAADHRAAQAGLGKRIAAADKLAKPDRRQTIANL